MLKTGMIFGLTMILLGLSATKLPEDTLLTLRSWIEDGMGEQTVSESDKVLTNIFRVDASVTDARPRQVSLEVEGEHPDGCEYPVLVAQARRGNTIDIEVYREVPVDVVCPMILKPYRGTIKLDGAFEAGEYRINVNTHSQILNI